MSRPEDDEHPAGDAEATLSIQPIDDLQSTELETMSIGSLDTAPHLSSAVGALATLVQATPELAAALAQRGRYLVEFSVKGQGALKSGAVQLLQRRNGRLQATLVTGGARVKENAVLASRVAQGAAAAAAVAHLAILITVQAQLVSMERTLERIEKKVDELRTWLKNDKLATFQGRLKALCQLRDEMATMEWTADNRQRWLIALDQADTEFHQLEDFSSRGCQDAEVEVARAKLGMTVFGGTAESLLREFEATVARYRDHHDLRLMCLLGRLAVAQVRRGLGGNAPAGQIDHDIVEALTATQKHETLVSNRALEITSWFRPARVDIESRRRVRDEAHEFGERSKTLLGALTSQTKMLDPLSTVTTRTVIEVGDGGQISGVLICAPDPAGR